MSFTWDQLKDAFSVLNLIGTAIVAAFVWIKGRDNATNDRLDGHDQRLYELERKMGEMPTHEDLKQIRNEMVRNAEKLDQLLGESRARNVILDRIHQYLLERDK